MSCRTTQIDSEDGTSLRTMTAASHRPGLLVPPPSTWLGSVRTAWQQNKGPGLVVLAQLFASLMNAATRMLETESGRMQTFQVRRNCWRAELVANPTDLIVTSCSFYLHEWALLSSSAAHTCGGQKPMAFPLATTRYGDSCMSVE